MVKFGASNIITSLYGEFWCQQHALCPTKQVKHEQFNVYMPFIQSYLKHIPALVKNISLITLISISDYTILSVKNGLLELQNCLKIVPQEL